MKSAISKSMADRAVETIAALCLCAAIASAIFQLMPLTGGVRALAALTGGVAAGVAAFALVASVAPRDFAMPAFAPALFGDCEDDVLLLDVPIAASAAEPRPELTPLPRPAEMIARIDHFLDAGSGGSGRSEPHDAIRPDASAALHAALAEIRHSLRQT